MRELLVLIVVAISINSMEGTRTHLMGLDGLCLDSGGRSRYNIPKLLPCEAEGTRQLWNILDDGTIRWTNDRCLFPYGKQGIPQYILVKTGMCNELTREDKTWSLNKNGTLLHIDSGLVLTVQTNNNPWKSVNVEPNRNAASQIWDAPEEQHPVGPRVVRIMGLHSYQCLWIKPPRVLLNNCTRGEGSDLEWALFEDGTIRANADTSQCLSTRFGAPNPYYYVGVMKCEDRAEQRWEVEADGTIHHVDSGLVMDVITIMQQQFRPEFVVLFTRNGADTQQWTFVE